MDDREGASVPTLLGAALGVLVGCAVLFGVIGMARDGDTTPAIDDIAASPVDDPAASPADDPAASPADDTELDEASPDPDEASPDAEMTPEPDPEVSPEPEATEAPEPDPTEEPEPEPSGQAVDPSTISIQVLDAVGGGDSSAAQKVADELRTAGYNVVVVNKAGKTYAKTTLFWSAGQEAGGRQIAKQFSIGEAEETPDEVQLSNSVDVHVVVGTDRA